MVDFLQPVSQWKSRLIFSFMVALCCIGLLVATSIVWRTFFNSPPIILRSLNPPYLGVICPGETYSIDNQVTIGDEVIIHYFVSVLDWDAHVNIPGTQRAYTDYLHPYRSQFVHHLVWQVPVLPPGSYSRVFAVRKVSGNEDTIFVISRFTIGDNCEEAHP